jgi:hypothetical protein
MASRLLRHWPEQSRIALACVLLGVAAPAWAVEVTDVLDAFDTEVQDPFDFALRLRFDSDSREAFIAREWKCLAGDQIGTVVCPNGSQVIYVRELAYQRRRNTLNIDARVGLYKDLEAYATFPVVLYDQWNHEFYDKSVTQKNSTIRPAADSESLFKVPFDSKQRGGFGDMTLGLKYAPFNYYRDRTEPTWVLGVAWVLPTGTPMKANNAGAGSGINELQFMTTASRRALGIFEPFFNLHGGYRWGSPSGLFIKQPNTQTQPDKDPGFTAGTYFGLTLVPWENIEREERVEIEGGLGMDYVARGRDYSEVWEALASKSNPCQPTAGCSNTSHWKSDPDSTTGRITTTDGITDVYDFGRLTYWGALHYQPIKYFQISAKIAMTQETPHFISGGKYGINLDPSRGSTIEQSNSDGKNEFSPVFLPAIDTPGQRLRVQDASNLQLVIAISGKI